MRALFILLAVLLAFGLTNAQCPPMTKSNADWPPTPVNTYGNGTCVSGWKGSPSRLCKSDGTWADSVLSPCTRVFCPQIIEGNANFSSTQGLSTRVGVCLPSYGGNVRRYCDGQGNWGPLQGSCAKCAAETYSHVQWDETPAKAFDYGTCELGYVGSPYRWCADGGVWQSYVWNVCMRGKCNATTLDNAEWKETNTFDMTVGTCVSGFIGTPKRYCNADGTFGPIYSGSCTSTSILCNASYSGRATWSPTNSGSIATGVCDPGWQGSPTRACLAEGVWSTSIQNHCVRKVCNSEVVGSITFPQTNAGSLAKGSCESGTTAVNGPYRTCTIEGTWAPTFRGSCV